MTRGLFITFEGGEGTGKTTQIGMLEQALEAKGHRVMLSREPGGTPFAEAVRSVLLSPDHQPDGLCEYFLLAACRRDHVRRILRPALEDGVTVLCDRFSDSSVVYQGIVRGVGETVIEDLDLRATDGLTPDLTIVLDIDPDEALPRVRARNRGLTDAESRLDDEPMEFHRQVRAGFLKLAGRHGRRIVVIDAAGAENEVRDRIMKILPEALR